MPKNLNKLGIRVERDNTQSKEIKFYDSCLPGLVEGDYIITIEQKLEDNNIPPKIQNDDLIPVKQNFKVQGTRFVLPPDFIHAYSPPPNSTGAYQKNLAHIILNKPTVPWELRLQQNSPNMPWLAVLLLTNDELEAITPSQTDTSSNADLSSTSRICSMTIEQLISGNSSVNIIKPDFTQSISEDEKKIVVQCIQISTDTFKNTVPYRDELPYLVHAREVNINNSSLPPDNTKFSIVMTNRLPDDKATTTQTYFAHLVSLEGLDNLLPPTSSNDIKNLASDSNYKSVQLISLANWSFNCSPITEESLESALKNVVNNKGDNYLLQMPPLDSGNKSEGNYVNDQLTRGFVPLAYNTRQAETTPVWYRGPFSPVPIAQQPLTTFSNVTNSDDLRRYDESENKNYGMLDLSYVVAWQLGRSLAMADPAFMQNLKTYRHDKNINDWSLHHTSGPLAATVIHATTVWQKLLHSNKTDPSSDIDSPTVNLVATLPEYVINPMKTILSAPHKPRTSSSTFFKSAPIPQMMKYQAKNNIINSICEQRKNDLLSLDNAKEITTSIINLTLKLPESLENWLMELYFSVKTPFSYLAANNQLLPAESIRFFYVDTNWLNALTAGALSIGVHTSLDHSLNGPILYTINTYLEKKSLKPVAGFMMYSQALISWPGLSIKAVDEKEESVMLSQRKLSPAVLLCLTKAIPNKVTIMEPHEQLALEVKKDTQSEYIELDTLTKARFNLLFRPPFTQKVLNLKKIQKPENRQPSDFSDEIKQPSQWAASLLSTPLEVDFEAPLSNRPS